MLRERLSKGHVGLVRGPCERQLGVLGMRLFANSLHVSKFATDASSRERMLSNKELASAKQGAGVTHIRTASELESGFH